MKVENLIRERRTIHLYQSEPVSEEIFQKTIEAAIWAPNHKLTLPWVFYRTTVATRKKLGSLSADLKAKKSGQAATPAQRLAAENKFQECGELLVLGIKKSGNTTQEKEDYAAMACAVQNMSLYLWSVGLGSKWSTGGATNDPLTYEILGVNPQGVELCGFFWIGKAKEVPDASARPTWSEFVVVR